MTTPLPNEVATAADDNTPWGTTYMPKRTSSESAIVLPNDAHKLNLKPDTIQLLPTFHGLEKENPYTHLILFEEVCSTCFDEKTKIESVYLKLFPFSVKDKAKNWLNSLRPNSITSWSDLQTEFLQKFFSLTKTYALKNQITNFRQKENEQFDEVWERFKDLLLACPHHGYDLRG